MRALSNGRPAQRLALASSLGPTTPRPGYFFLAGSVAADSLTYADEPLVHANIATFVDYVATRTIRDVSCSLAGDRTYTSNLQSFDGPVIMFAGGHGFGPEMLETAGLMTNAKITTNYNADYGHVDHVFSTRHTQEVEHPVLAWLLHDVK